MGQDASLPRRHLAQEVSTLSFTPRLLGPQPHHITTSSTRASWGGTPRELREHGPSRPAATLMMPGAGPHPA